MRVYFGLSPSRLAMIEGMKLWAHATSWASPERARATVLLFDTLDSHGNVA
jgi:hypothetical protein